MALSIKYNLRIDFYWNQVIEVPLPYADQDLTAEVTPGILTPVYPAYTEYPPESQPNPQYPPEVYTPPDVYTHAEVFLDNIFRAFQ